MIDRHLLTAELIVGRALSRRIVVGTCSPAGASAWEIEALPPDESAFNSGARAYRCVAAVPGAEPGQSEFGGYSRAGGLRVRS